MKNVQYKVYSILEHPPPVTKELSYSKSKEYIVDNEEEQRKIRNCIFILNVKILLYSAIWIKSLDVPPYLITLHVNQTMPS